MCVCLCVWHCVESELNVHTQRMEAPQKRCHIRTHTHTSVSTCIKSLKAIAISNKVLILLFTPLYWCTQRARKVVHFSFDFCKNKTALFFSLFFAVFYLSLFASFAPHATTKWQNNKHNMHAISMRRKKNFASRTNRAPIFKSKKHTYIDRIVLKDERKRISKMFLSLCHLLSHRAPFHVHGYISCWNHKL